MGIKLTARVTTSNWRDSKSGLHACLGIAYRLPDPFFIYFTLARSTFLSSISIPIPQIHTYLPSRSWQLPPSPTVTSTTNSYSIQSSSSRFLPTPNSSTSDLPHLKDPIFLPLPWRPRTSKKMPTSRQGPR